MEVQRFIGHELKRKNSEKIYTITNCEITKTPYNNIIIHASEKTNTHKTNTSQYDSIRDFFADFEFSDSSDEEAFITEYKKIRNPDSCVIKASEADNKAEELQEKKGEGAKLRDEPQSTCRSTPAEKSDEEKKRDIGKIYEELKRRGVKYLCHFTPIENLDGIFKYGICPRDILEQKNVPFTFTDETGDVLRNTFMSCYSISFPNYQMMYSKKKNDGFKFAVLLIDIEAIKNISYDDIHFYEGNASAGNIGNDKKDFRGYDSFIAMFAPSVTRTNGKKVERHPNLTDEYTTNPQAEIKISVPIDQKYIKSIYIENSTRENCDFNNKPFSSKVEIDQNTYFAPRFDYELWNVDRGGNTSQADE